jgi:hypothetical protein
VRDSQQEENAGAGLANLALRCFSSIGNCCAEKEQLTSRSIEGVRIFAYSGAERKMLTAFGDMNQGIWPKCEWRIMNGEVVT